MVSAAAPLTIVVGIAPLALAAGGMGAPSIYIAAALGLGLFAIGFMALAPVLRRMKPTTYQRIGHAE